MMQLAEAKGRFLCEMDHVPSDELPLWIAFYEIQAKEREREERRARQQQPSVPHVRRGRRR